MKKVIIVLCGVLVLVAAIIFGLQETREEEIVIELGIYSGNEWGVPQIDVYKIYEEAIELFQIKYENVKVVFQSGTLLEDYSERFAQDVLQGTEPDVFIVLEEDFNTLSEIGMLEALNPYIDMEDEGFKDDYYAKALEAGNYNGQQYAMPFEIVPTFMIVNNTLLTENNIRFPSDDWTVDQFMEISQQLTKDTDGDNALDQFGSVGYEWYHAYYAANGDFIAGDKAVDIYDETKLASAIDFTKALYQLNRGYIVDGTDFGEGSVGFKPFSLAEFRAYKPYPYRIKKYSNFEWEAVPFPVFEENESQGKLYTVQLGMSSRSKEKALAWEFIKFLSSDEVVQQMVWDNTYALPTKISVVDNIYSNYDNSDDILDPEFLKMIIEQSVVEPTFKEYNQIMAAMHERIKLNILEATSTEEIIRSVRKNVDDILFNIK